MAGQLSKVTPTGSWNESVKAGTTAPLARKLMGAQNPTVGFGGQIAKFGRGIAAAAGLMDAVQYVFAGIRVSGQGDRDTAKSYWVASGLTGFSSLMGVGVIFAGSSTLLGPLGIAILLGLSAYAIATQAKREVSTPLELWARKSRWGIPLEHRAWQSETEQDIATSALNGAILGIAANTDIHVDFQRHPSSPHFTIGETYSVASTKRLSYHMTIPNFHSKYSRYEWQLNTYHPNTPEPEHTYSGNSEELNQEENRTLTQANAADATYTPQQTITIQNSIILDEHDMTHAIELSLSYWPDKSDLSRLAQVIVRKDKL
ncbi:hypothetical protein ACNFG0_22655 [Pseudomonas sp. NY15372]|uniref:hypothetical protein n=1 Tax=Pseudomonas sp. NY15372 TaxID=3400356 RepID=UPI003A87C75C